MLAQSFMTAAELGLTDAQHSALIKTLALMDAGGLTHVTPDCGGRYQAAFSGNFNMAHWQVMHSCGTACCIGGTAELIGGLERFELDCPATDLPALKSLFFGGRKYDQEYLESITVPQAAMALRSYLTTGDARWDLALSDQQSRGVADPSREAV